MTLCAEVLQRTLHAFADDLCDSQHVADVPGTNQVKRDLPRQQWLTPREEAIDAPWRRIGKIRNKVRHEREDNGLELPDRITKSVLRPSQLETE
ncbi:MAG: hypothetical protein JNM32_09595 [Dechloromonas sp.]|nr:hypothetical protein [Dechloromonas sp.]